MLLLLIQWLQEIFGEPMPSVFSYTSTRMACALVASLAFSIWLGPVVIRTLYAWKIGQPIRKQECPALHALHKQKENTPTMGGLLMLACQILALLLWMDLSHSFTWILAMTTLGLGGLGAVDDWKKLKYKNARGLPARAKLLVQLSIAGLIAAYLLIPGLAESLQKEALWQAPSAKWAGDFLDTASYAKTFFLPFFKHPVVVYGPLALLIFCFVAVGASNAVNLTDGLDGLAAGCMVLVAATFAVIAFLSNHMGVADYLNIIYIEGSGEVAIYLSALVGTCLGFLWYNGHPAQVFMGDTGSLPLGGIVGVTAILLRREVLLAVVGGIFVVEALSVIIQVLSFRYRGQRRVFLCAPLHHHFEYLGWPETKVTLRFWIVGLLLAIVGLASLKFQ